MENIRNYAKIYEINSSKYIISQNYTYDNLKELTDKTEKKNFFDEFLFNNPISDTNSLLVTLVKRAPKKNNCSMILICPKNRWNTKEMKVEKLLF